MKRNLFLVVVGLILATPSFAAELFGSSEPLFKLQDSRQRSHQVVVGLLAENLHSSKDAACAGKACWKDFEEVFRQKGKPTRVERFSDYEKGSRDKVERLVYYYDSEKQTEVFVFVEAGAQEWKLKDDYVTSTVKFSASRDRFEY